MFTSLNKQKESLYNSDHHKKKKKKKKKNVSISSSVSNAFFKVFIHCEQNFSFGEKKTLKAAADKKFLSHFFLLGSPRESNKAKSVIEDMRNSLQRKSTAVE